MQAFLSHRGKDAYDLLGLAEDATLPAVQEAYLAFAERYAPRHFDSAELRGVADKARDLFLAGARAYGALADPEQRASLLDRRRALREERSAIPPPDYTIKTDLLDPDVQFKRGLALAEAGQFLDAITQLEFASDCDPGNGRYRAELAWCRHRQFGGMVTREVMAELEEAMRVDPACGLAAYYAGLLQAGLGRAAEAEVNLRKAMKLLKGDRRPIEALKKLHGIKKG
jgi:tetratricopeptide (TPR) repeat protein